MNCYEHPLNCLEEKMNLDILILLAMQFCNVVRKPTYVLQSFKLPHLVLCIVGVVKIELLGGVVNDAFDGHMVSCSTLVEILRCFDMIISSIALIRW
jgi:hypothetical protein